MKKENKMLMLEAREALEGNWKIAASAALMIAFVSGFARLVPVIGGLIVAGPMAFGSALYFLTLSRKQTPFNSYVFKGFSYFVNTFIATLLIMLYTVLWMLLLIVPGIIAALSYSQVFFILAENPTMSASDAIAKSKAMMEGYKWKYFCLGLRFIGWAILCIFTLGIGFLFLAPYMQVTFAKFYDDIKGEAKEVKREETVAPVEEKAV